MINNLQLSLIAFYDNNLPSDQNTRDEISSHTIDGVRLITEKCVMDKGGFGGILSVENEDTHWGGTEAKVKVSQQVAYKTLRPLIVN